MNLKKKLKRPDLLLDKCFIGGKWIGGKDIIKVINPSTGELVSSVPKFGAGETRKAIVEANKAGLQWRAKTASERAKIMRSWFNLMMGNQEDLAMIMTAEQGKPMPESRGEIAYAASFIEWFAEEAKRIYGDVIPPPKAEQRIMVLRQPVGVIAAITPWNFPAAMITRKIAPALASGCTAIIKPASQTPLSALALVKLAEEAGVPAGVLNVVTGSAQEIGKELTENPLVRKISFTGSTETGKILIRQAASTVKKISMELGGNAPFIVFDDADLDLAVAGFMASKYRNSGQTCVCANRLLVQDKIHDAYLKKLLLEVKKLKVGDGFIEGVNQGPLINMAAVEKVEMLIKDAVKKGAKVKIGGSRHKLGGTFFEPTVLTNAKTNMQLAAEEIFGPVAPIFRFKTEEEAVKIANDTQYGLAAYFYSNDVNRIFRVAENLEYGMVGINEGMISNEVAPFGGVKQSGMGREGSYMGINEYVEVKYFCLGNVKKP